jgi:hypothetical protein
MSQFQTTILTAALRSYDKYAIVFAASAMHSTRDTRIEIILSDKARFLAENKAALTILANYFGEERLCLSQIPELLSKAKMPPHSVRFLFEPSVRTDYVYITDVDFIMLEQDFLELYLKDMDRTGFDFSNVVRHRTKRLTGLHFTKWDAYYPVDSAFVPLAATHGDENLLYKIVESRAVVDPKLSTFRVHPGLHISPNAQRDFREYIDAAVAFFNSPVWQEISPLVAPEIHDAITSYYKAVAFGALRPTSRAGFGSEQDFLERRP